MPPVIRDDRLRHIIRQIHVAEPAVAYAVPIGYGRLVPDEDFIQRLELFVQLQAPVPAPGIALGLKNRSSFGSRFRKNPLVTQYCWKPSLSFEPPKPRSPVA